VKRAHYSFNFEIAKVEENYRFLDDYYNNKEKDMQI
jgi:hypothetical protein